MFHFVRLVVVHVRVVNWDDDAEDDEAYHDPRRYEGPGEAAIRAIPP